MLQNLAGPTLMRGDCSKYWNSLVSLQSVLESPIRWCWQLISAAIMIFLYFSRKENKGKLEVMSVVGLEYNVVMCRDSFGAELILEEKVVKGSYNCSGNTISCAKILLFVRITSGCFPAVFSENILSCGWYLDILVSFVSFKIMVSTLWLVANCVTSYSFFSNYDYFRVFWEHVFILLATIICLL